MLFGTGGHRKVLISVVQVGESAIWENPTWGAGIAIVLLVNEQYY
jgi:hypothetical protein